MYRQQVTVLLNFIMLIDAIIVIVAGYLTYYICLRFGRFDWFIPQDILLYTVLYLIFINNFIMGQLGLYSSKRSQSFWEIFRKLILAVILDILFLSAAYYLTKNPISRYFTFLYGIFLLGFFTIEKLIIEWFLDLKLKKGFGVRRILLVGPKERADIVKKTLDKQRSWGHKVVGFLAPDEKEKNLTKSSSEDIPCLGKLSDFKDILIKEVIDEVIFCLGPEHSSINLKPYLDISRKIGVSYRIVPAMYSLKEKDYFEVEKIQDIPTLVVSTHNINASGMFYKRILDISVGLIGCLILAAIYPFVAIAIKLDSEGPVIFKQKRVGMNGRIFTLYKFRTMYKDAEQRKKELLERNEMQGCIFKIKNDPRVTRVGRFLRKTSLDEFPQFINVLLGQMSIVGTRPPTPDEVEQYELWHLKRICVKPGITGLWQVSGRNEITDFDEIVKLDLKYIENWRFRDDLYIILKTIFVVLSRKGAM